MFVLLSPFDTGHDFIGLSHSYLSVVSAFNVKCLNCVPTSLSSAGQYLSEWVSGQLPWLAQPLTGQQLICLFKLICLPVSLTHMLEQGISYSRPQSAQSFPAISGPKLHSTQKSRTLLPKYDETTESAGAWKRVSLGLFLKMSSPKVKKA